MTGFDFNVATSIPRLFGLRYEAAVLGAVVAIVVNTIQRQSLGVSIGQGPIAEWFKSMPFWTNCNATSAIVAECGYSWIIATLFHVIPDIVKAAGSMVYTVAVSAVGFTSRLMGAINFGEGSLDSQASARIRLSLNKGVNSSPNLFSANAIGLRCNALAKPLSSVPIFTAILDNTIWPCDSQIAKRPTSKIFSWSHYQIISE